MQIAQALHLRDEVYPLPNVRVLLRSEQIPDLG
jgi:hypothetical protein